MSENQSMGTPGPIPGSTPPPTSSGSFFNSIRSSGWYRANNRVLGGVCSGIAAHTGWDLGLVRALTVILGLFFPPTCIAYGVAWLLLPEQNDGRIHLESLTLGRFDIAQVGALLMVLAGLGNPFPWFVGHGRSVIYWLFCLVIILAIAVIVIISISRGADPRTRRSSWPQTPPPSQAWSATPGAGAPSTGVPPYGGAPNGWPWAASGVSPHTGSAPQTGGQPRPAPGPQAPSPAWGPSSAAAPQPGPTWPASGTPGTPVDTRVPEGTRGPRPAGSGPTQAFQTPRPAGPNPNGWRAPSGPQGSNAPQVRAWVPPAPVPVRKVSHAVNLLVVGLIALIIAGALSANLFFGDTTESSARSCLNGTGLVLIVTGIALAIASFKDRSAGVLIALSLVGVIVALPVALVSGTSLSDDYAYTSNSNYPPLSGSASTDDVESDDWTADTISGYDSAAGSHTVDLDLSGAPADLAKTITVDNTSMLTVAVRQGQSLGVNIEGSASGLSASYYTDPSGHQLSHNWVPNVAYISDSLFFRSDSWNPDAGITLNIRGNNGEIRIVETAPGTPTPVPSPSPSTGASSEAPQSGSTSSPGPTAPIPSTTPPASDPNS